MSDTDLICICMTVTRGEISQAVKEGHTSVAELKNILMCCTGCGTCEKRVQAVIDETVAGAKAEKKDVA